jgi:threonine/homoserine/homoserine lactone efflux protein
VAGGAIFHVTAGFMGLTTLIWQVAWLLALAKIAGAAYLFYLGIKAITHRSQPLNITGQAGLADFNRSNAFKTGLYTCLSNPKSALFYLSLFTVIIPKASPLWAQVSMMLIMITISLSWYGSVAILFSRPAIRNSYARAERLMNYLAGGVLIALGLKIALARS